MSEVRPRAGSERTAKTIAIALKIKGSSRTALAADEAREAVTAREAHMPGEPPNTPHDEARQHVYTARQTPQQPS